MLFKALFLAVPVIAQSNLLPSNPGGALPYAVPSLNTTGFNDATVQPARGGLAVCVSGTIPVTASANNLKINFPLPINQTTVTQTLINLITPNFPAGGLVSGMQPVSGTYQIAATLCLPGHTNGSEPTTVQFLTHGVGFDRYYWDFAPGYSYVDYAASQGYATFFYDRLGVGESQKADAINEVQTPLELAIAVELIRQLRAGSYGGIAFQKVVGVGHSFGSILTQAVTASSPSSLDGAVLTGFTANSSGLPGFLAGNNFVIAANNNPYRFNNLSTGYLVTDTAVGVQIAFFHQPGFDPQALAAADAGKGTVTFGEFFSLGAVGGPATNYTGAIAVVNAAYDLPFCSGNCSYPTNLGAAVIPALYPRQNGTNNNYIQRDAGHGLTLHYSAVEGYAYIQDFVRRSGL